MRAMTGGVTEEEVRWHRQGLGVHPVFKRIDSCAAEFEAYTPYYYSTYDRGDDEVKGKGEMKTYVLIGPRASLRPPARA